MIDDGCNKWWECLCLGVLGNWRCTTFKCSRDCFHWIPPRYGETSWFPAFHVPGHLVFLGDDGDGSSVQMTETVKLQRPVPARSAHSTFGSSSVCLDGRCLFWLVLNVGKGGMTVNSYWTFPHSLCVAWASCFSFSHGVTLSLGRISGPVFKLQISMGRKQEALTQKDSLVLQKFDITWINME